MTTYTDIMPVTDNTHMGTKFVLLICNKKKKRIKQVFIDITDKRSLNILRHDRPGLQIHSFSRKISTRVSGTYFTPRKAKLRRYPANFISQEVVHERIVQ